MVIQFKTKTIKGKGQKGLNTSKMRKAQNCNKNQNCNSFRIIEPNIPNM